MDIFRSLSATLLSLYGDLSQFGKKSYSVNSSFVARALRISYQLRMVLYIVILQNVIKRSEEGF